MNRKDIIRMAREAGLPHWYEDDTLVNESRVIKFAAFVASAEREACAKVCDDLDALNWKETGEYCSGYGSSIRARGERVDEMAKQRHETPKREWVGLTDEQISRIWGSYFSRAFEFARAIEAKLKEKNGG